MKCEQKDTTSSTNSLFYFLYKDYMPFVTRRNVISLMQYMSLSQYPTKGDCICSKSTMYTTE